jgi:hypothetical protein
MKKYIIGGTIILVSGAIFLWTFLFSNSYIYRANENIDVEGFKLLLELNSARNLLDKDFNFLGGFGCNPYESKNGDFRIIFSGFPDVTKGNKLTEIATTNPNHSFYGIHPGDDAQKAIDVLTAKGFHRLLTKDENSYMEFGKRKLYVSINKTSDGKISEIRMRLKATNKRNVVF